jgi:hypothetical protein
MYFFVKSSTPGIDVIILVQQSKVVGNASTTNCLKIMLSGLKTALIK